MTSPKPSCSSCGKGWLPFLLAMVLFGIILFRGQSVRNASTDTGDPSRGASTSETAGQTVSLSINYGDGVRRSFKPIAWRKGMTVRDITRETPRENLKLEVRGEGDSAFLANLDGVANEGAEGNNWTYHVNDKSGDRSFAIYELQAGDQVLWTFGGQQ